MGVELETYVPLEEAAREYNIPDVALTRLMEDGKIKAVRINGGTAVAERDVQALAFGKRDQMWEQVKRLEGIPISMSDACEKYRELNFASLSRWIKQGYIRTIGKMPQSRGRGHKKLLNEADVAYATLILRQRGKQPGKRVFTPETIPPHLVSSS